MVIPLKNIIQIRSYGKLAAIAALKNREREREREREKTLGKFKNACQ
jgi:hypothetical protein